MNTDTLAIAALIAVALIAVALIAILAGAVYLRRPNADPARYAQWMNEARAAVAANDLARAGRVYRRVVSGIHRLKTPPPDLIAVLGQALLAWGDIDQAAGRSEDAVRHYRDAMRVTDAPPRVVLIVAGNYIRRAAESDEAIEVYLAHLRQVRGMASPDDPVLAFLHSKCVVTPETPPAGLNAIRVLAGQVADADPDVEWAHFWLGMALARLGRLDDAVTALQRAEMLQPGRPATTLQLGVIHRLQNRPGLACAAFKRSLHADAKNAEAWFQLAQVDWERGTPEAEAEAAECLARASQLDSGRADIWFWLSRAELKQNRLNAARDACARSASLEPGNVEYLMTYAGLLAGTQDFASAAGALRQVIAANPNYTPAHLRLADLLLQDHAYADAATSYGNALSLDAQSIPARMGLGRSLYEMGRLAEAIEQLRGVASPDRAALHALARAYGRTDQPALAVETHRRWIAQFGPDVEACYALACAQGRLGQWAAALQAFDQAQQELDRRGAVRGDVLFYRGVALARLGRLDEARTAYESAQAAWPGQARICYALGALAFQQNHIGSAVEHFRAAASADAQSAPAWLGLGMAHERAGDWERAIEAYDRCLSLAPAEWSARSRLGVAQARTGRWDAALTHLKAALSRKSSDELLFHLGLAQVALSQFKDAVATWQVVRGRYPDDGDMAANLAVALYQLGGSCYANKDYAGAQRCWEQCAALQPPAAEVQRCLGAAYARSGVESLMAADDLSADSRAALGWLEKAVATWPTDVRPYYYLGLAALVDGDPHRAIRVLSPLAESGAGDSRSCFFLALAHGMAGNPARAAFLLEQVQPFAQQFAPVYHVARGNLALVEGRWSEAFDAFRSAIQPPPAAAPGAAGDLARTLFSRIAACASHSNRPDEGRRARAPWAAEERRMPEARRYLGLLAAQAADYDAAAEVLAPLCAEGGRDLAGATAQVLLRRAARRAAQGDLASAAADVSQAARLDPASEVARRASASLRDWLVIADIRAGRFDPAAQRWEREFEQSPADLGVHHRLAVLCYRAASSLDGPAAAGDQSRQADAWWRKAIGHWAVVLRSPAFWEQWRAQRLKAADLSLDDDDMAEARKSVEERLLRDFRDGAADCQAAGNAAGVARCQELEILWGMELRTATCVGECAQAFRVAGWPSQFACGPLMLDRLMALPAGQPMALALKRAVPSFGGETGVKLQQALSPLGRAHFLMDENRLEQAIAELEKLATWPQARSLLGAACLARGLEAEQVGNLEQALAAFDRASDCGADVRPQATLIAGASVARAKAVLEADDDDYDQAIRVLERGARLAGRTAELGENLAAAYARKGRVEAHAERYDEAVRCLRQALEYAPQDDRIRHSAHVTYHNYAMSVAKTDADKAVGLFKEALSFEQADDTRRALSSLLFGRALDMAQARNRDRAVTLMRDEIAYDPEARVRPTTEAARKRLKEVLIVQATQSSEQGRLSQAITELQEACHYQDDGQVRLLLAAFLRKAGRDDEAIQVLNDAIQKGLGDADVKEGLHVMLHNRGVDLANQGNMSRAADFLRQSLAVMDSANTRETLALVLKGRASQLAGQKQYDQAVDLLRQALRMNDIPDNRQALAFTLRNRGVAKYNAGDPYGARQDVREAIQFDPYNHELKQLLNQMNS